MAPSADIILPSNAPAELKEAAKNQDIMTARREQPKSPQNSPNLFESKPGVTYASQDNLSKLPIQELPVVCKKYLEAVKPLQTKREHAETVAAVREFLKTDGPELQERLKKYASDKSSYIEQFCKHL